MNESILSQTQLTDQMSGRDPFQMAQQSASQMPVSTQSLMLGGPGQDMPMQTPQPMASQQPQDTVSALFNQPGAQQSQISNFNKLMQSSGIDDGGLQYNDLGQMQLRSRLSQKFGQGFMQNQQAMDIMKAFDQYRTTMKPPDNTGALDASKRTLAALMGGQ